MSKTDIIIALVCMMLLGGSVWTIVYEPANTIQSNQAADNSLDVSAPSSLQARALSPKATLTETTSRSLFEEDRRWVLEAKPRPVVQAKLQKNNYAIFDQLNLVGIVTDESKRVAIFSRKGQGEPLRLSLGGALGEWVVAGIYVDRVVFQFSDEKRVVLITPTGVSIQSSEVDAIPGKK